MLAKLVFLFFSAILYNLKLIWNLHSSTEAVLELETYHKIIHFINNEKMKIHEMVTTTGSFNRATCVIYVELIG